MRIENLNTWDEFDQKLKDISSEKVPSDYSVSDSTFGQCRMLYRGQGDSNWDLQTTLERFTNKQYRILDYLDVTTRIVSEIESFTDSDFNIQNSEHILKEMNENSSVFNLHLPIYNYWAYLRHNGFPSPLLDWTFSPYIAAFFAFFDETESERCAVYIYVEYPAGIKSSSGTDPRINVFGPYVRTHKRHFLQQSWYSIAVQGAINVPDPVDYSLQNIISHEEIFKLEKEDQDLIIKLTLPKTEKESVLKYLNKYNINLFSLFQTEESLLKTIAFKVLK